MTDQPSRHRAVQPSASVTDTRINVVPLRDLLDGLRPRQRRDQPPGSARPYRVDSGTWLITGGSPDRIRSAARQVAAGLERALDAVPIPPLLSRYIGETEKNLSRALDSARAGDVVLFFDEADALFGKRTEVRDGHDRYANAEISYLLDRLAARGGLAMLGCSDRVRIDPAFLRRFQRVIRAPDAASDDDG
jgi:hypothetical protein